MDHGAFTLMGLAPAPLPGAPGTMVQAHVTVLPASERISVRVSLHPATRGMGPTWTANYEPQPPTAPEWRKSWTPTS